MSDARSVEVRIRQVREIHGDLSRLFDECEWGGLAGGLATLSKVAENAGHQDLCLKAQSLRELLGHRGGGRASEPGERVTELMQELLSQVSHWSWSLAEGANRPGSQLSH